MKILSTIRAGNVVRLALYSPRDAKPNTRRRSMGISKEDKNRANLKTSYEKLLMVVCANIEPGDYFVTFTYRNDCLPANRKEARPYWQKFMRPFRKYKKNNKDPLVYFYSTQMTTTGGGIRLHHHMLLRREDDHDEERIRSLWTFGWVDIHRLRDWDDIIDKVHYMCREPRELGVKVPGERMWTPSRGVARPEMTFTTIDNDAVDITFPVGCTPLSDPVQIPGYGGYKSIIYYQKPDLGEASPLLGTGGRY